MERLKFMQYVSQVSDFKVTKVQLKAIYGLFASSPVTSDQQYFMLWCRNASRDNTLNLSEVGSFLSDLIADKDMEIATMPLVGLCFVQDYFLGLNESEGKLKVLEKQKVEEIKKMGYGSNFAWNTPTVEVVDDSDLKASNDDDDALPLVEINVDPTTLQKLELIWTVTLNSEVEAVYDQASSFLVLLYTHIKKDVEGLSTPDVINGFIERCITMLKSSTSPGFVQRVCGLLSKLIDETEKKTGTQGNIA